MSSKFRKTSTVLRLDELVIFSGLMSLLDDIVLRPRQCDDNEKRKELVCNTILLFIIFLLFCLNILNAYTLITETEHGGIQPMIMYSITSSFICLLYLSRKGFLKLASHTLVLILVYACIYGQISYGFDLPSIILLWCFIITASSILIHTRYALILAICIGTGSIILLILEQHHVLVPVRKWKLDTFMIDDAIEYSIILILIAGISWLSNREIERSFRKVKISEGLLREERDNLDIKVRQKTEEIQNLHIEKINSMYRFVEFGRISSGLFHDLIGPLNSLCISVGAVNIPDTQTNREHKDVLDIQKKLQTAVRVSQHISLFISQAKKQIQKDTESTCIRFSIIEETKNTISLLDSKLKKHSVLIHFNPSKNIWLIGSPTVFSHIMTNLISNAIDSYVQVLDHKQNDKIVIIYTHQKKDIVEICIKDFGIGIPENIKDHIFDPFFTTKLTEGCGIGLSSTKHSLEKYFKGSISLKTSSGTDTSGTTFIIRIPKIRHVNSI